MAGLLNDGRNRRIPALNTRVVERKGGVGAVHNNQKLKSPRTTVHKTENSDITICFTQFYVIHITHVLINRTDLQYRHNSTNTPNNF